MNPQAPNRDDVLRLVQRAGAAGALLSRIAAQVGISRPAAHRKLEYLRRDGLVVMRGRRCSPQCRWVSVQPARDQRPAWCWDDRGRSAVTRADVVEGIRRAEVLAPVPWG